MLPDDQPPPIPPPPERDDHRGRRAWAGEVLVDEEELGTTDLGFALPPGPGVAARHAAGDRRLRAAAESSADDPMARDNWRPTGPRNVGGRVRALVMLPAVPAGANPERPVTGYAGLASGGVHKTTDGGESWFPLWHDQPSLAVGALAAAPDPTAAHDPSKDRVYAATGEVVPNGFNVGGHGIWVSSDGGATWTNGTAAPHPANPAHTHGFDAIAVDPGDRNHAWAVGPDGVFRTKNAGVSWDHFEVGTYWSDVAFSDGRLYLARGKSSAGEAHVARYDAPAAVPSGAAPNSLPAPSRSATLLTVDAAHLPWPGRTKLAIVASHPETMFARVVDEEGHHLAILRSTNARVVAPGAWDWVRLADSADFQDEEQGTYDLCLAVDPADANFLATGMQQLHVSRNADGPPGAVTFRQAMHWELHDQGLRAHHADHHQLVVLGGDLWVADDGGISRSRDWKTGEASSRTRPLAHNAIGWEKRDHGITAAQMYDLAQSPLVPTLYAAGMQDNGVHMTSGGPTWHTVFGADGGFVAFDPDDPFAYLLTIQSSIRSARFPGHHDLTFPDEQPPGRPTPARTLKAGFRPFDPPAFVADTDRHPLDRTRVLHTRLGRLYGLRGGRGEEWQVEPVGRGLDLRITRPGARLTVTLEDSDGARRLGLVPGTVERRAVDDPLTGDPPKPLTVAFVGRLPAPFDLRAGDQLRFIVNGRPLVVSFAAGDAVSPAATTLAEAIAAVEKVNRPDRKIEALPRLWDSPSAVELFTADSRTAAGAAPSITLGGTALADAGDGLSRLGLNAGTYAGDAGRPASLTLGFRGRRPEDQDRNRDLSGTPARKLTVSVNGRPARDVTFGGTDFPDPSRITAGELAAALTDQLGDDGLHAVPAATTKAVLLRARPGHTVVVSGSAADRLGLPDTPAEEIVIASGRRSYEHAGTHKRNHNSFDLTSGGAALILTIGDGAQTAGDLTFTNSNVGNLRSVTAEELHRLLSAHLAAAPAPGVEVDAELVTAAGRGQATEVHFSAARPGDVWVGGSDGLVARSTDNGVTWTITGAGKLDRADARVEALAVHPTNPDVAYVGHWTPVDLAGHHHLLHRTQNGGREWLPIGIFHDGRAVAVRAIELHPADPKIVFVATDNGVSWSKDEGANWAPFGNGLPNCPVTDLTLEPTGPTLRAAAWGRGTFERQVGGGTPDDVRLVIRQTELDDGSVRPAPAAPLVFADDPRPRRPASPDVKLVRDRPGAIGPVVDGVEFDLATPHDSAAVGQPAQVLVQVHNRGSVVARSDAAGPASAAKVRVVVLRAAVAVDPPALPADFWTLFRMGPLAGALGDWTVLGDAALTAGVVPGVPAVVGFPETWANPPTTPRLALLAIVSADEDEVTGGPVRIDELVAAERRVAYREAEVLTDAEDRTIVLTGDGGRDLQVLTAGSSAAAALGFTTLDALSARLVTSTAGGPTYDLSGVAAPALVIAQADRALDIDFDNAGSEFANFTAARPTEIAAFIARRVERAGLPLRVFPLPDGVQLRARGDATIEVRGGTAAAALAFTPVGAPPRLRGNAWVNLPGDPTLELRVTTPAGASHDTTVTFSADRMANRRVGDPRRVSAMINDQLRTARLEGAAVAEPVLAVGIAGDDSNDHTVEMTASGPMQAALGLPAGRDDFLQTPVAVVDLSAHAVRRLTLTVHQRRLVRFRAAAGISPAEIRRTINDALAESGIAGHAAAAVVRLRVGASSPDRAGRQPVLANAAVADVATSGPTAAGSPADLFDLRAAFGGDKLTAGSANKIYVRAHNEGNVVAADARFRVTTLSATGAPTAPEQTAVHTATPMPAEGTAIVELELTPAAATAGGSLLVLAVVDQVSRPVEIPGVDPGPPFADVDALLRFCRDHQGASLRQFDVSA